MRDDNIGLFWHDIVKVKGPKKGPPPKRTPPPKFWLNPEYLPGLNEATVFPVEMMSWEEVQAAKAERDIFFCDIECYPNYFLVAFTSYQTGKSFYLEMQGDDLSGWDRSKLWWILHNLLIVTFNGNAYDLPMLTFALSSNNTCAFLHEITIALIRDETRPYKLYYNWQLEELNINHIDLIEVCPLSASLKIYGGRLHTPRMQELPFPPTTILTNAQITIIRYYCINDLCTTAYVFVNLEDQLELRSRMSINYGLDLRSKSDAQVAEAVIAKELATHLGRKPTRPDIEPGMVYKYMVPPFLKFETPLMQNCLEVIRNANFIVGESGAIEKPPTIEELDIVIGAASYTMGIGGLHSCETRMALAPTPEVLYIDRDVSSYYPAIILNQKLFPAHLGPAFLNIYQRIVDRRLAAKKAKNKNEAEFLKIVVNGSFGKFGSKWSILYAPQLLIQVTITGQLSLLMLIERLELAGIRVGSANTDGLLILCPVNQRAQMETVVNQWEKDINFQTEATEYKSYYAKDVNNYIGIRMDDTVKWKGAYNNPWNDTPDKTIFRFHKNPVSTISIEAAVAYLKNGTPLKHTVETCTDPTKFVTVRTVKGGAVQGDKYLGKAIRWYYTKEQLPEMVYAESGNMVPNSTGAKPMMDLPATLPADLNWDYYTAEAARILVDIGRWPPPPKAPRLTAAQLKAAARLLPSPAPLAGGVWL